MAMQKIKTYLDLVKFEHTVFALPFAYAGMILAARGWPSLRVFVLVTLAMAGARTAAMALNRVIDAQIDARNPRTAMRHVPRGEVKNSEGIGLAVVSLLVLAISASALNPLCLMLMPIAMLFLVLYPYTKRHTWLCHAWLGITDGAAAAGGWIAVTGYFEPGAWWLWLVVVFWMIGLDVIYATQDVEFDKQEKLQSIPARFGLVQSLQFAKISHALTWLLLVLVGVATKSGWPYYLAVIVMGAILFYEHAIVKPNDLARVNVAFFSANAWLALTMLLGVVLDVVF